jgi:hypothetical protein
MANKKRSVLGLFNDPGTAADGVEALQNAGFGPNDFEIMTGAPYPEGTFGEEPVKHRLYYFPLVGAVVGLSLALLATVGTQLSWPLVTGGKPVLAIPPMAIISYEGTMLGAILFTILGIVFESRLPRLGLGLYDARINEGKIGLLVACEPDQMGSAIDAMQGAGVFEIKQEEWEKA